MTLSHSKVCFKCGESKGIDSFYKHSEMKDGHLNKCKDCAKVDSIENRKINIDYYRAYDRKRGSRQSSDWVKEYRENNPEKYKAHNKVNNMIRDGKMVKPDRCEDCDVLCKKLHGHHEDYLKPDVVEWLCPACHKQRHF